MNTELPTAILREQNLQPFDVATGMMCLSQDISHLRIYRAVLFNACCAMVLLAFLTQFTNV